MKTSRLRVIAIFLAVLALVIAACGPQATEEPTEEPAAEPTTAEVVDAEPTEEITEEATEEATEEMTDTEATEEATEEMGDVVDVAVNTEGFNVLVAAVQAAGLEETLREGEFTVFAPTDEAFEALLEELDVTQEDLLARDDLADILTYHVVAGTVTSDMLEAGDVETVNGATVTVSLDDGVMVNDATVVTADVMASNGVIHVIDSVLLPPAPEAEATDDMGDMEATAEATEAMDDMEATAEATDDMDAGAEATEAMGDMEATVEATEAMGDMEATAEATEAMGDMEATAEATEDMADMEATVEATEAMADMEATAEVTEAMGDMEATAEVTEAMGDMEATAEATEAMGDMEATAEATEAMGDMGGEMDMGEVTLYDGTFDFEYPSNYEVRESATVDTVSLSADSQQIMVVGPASYNLVIGGETFESEGDALAFYLERRGYTVGEMTDMMMGLASYDITLPRRGLVGAATLVDLNNDRRAVIIELADTAENVPNEVGAMVMETISYIDLVDTAIAADDFNVLVAAVQAAELEETLRSGEFTVFAPTDAAFEAALEALGLTQDELLASENLADILTYHVVEGTVTSDAVVELDGETVTTVQGATLTVGITEEGGVTLTDGMENTVNVVQTDIEAANGVIHVIDGVLLPPPEPEATAEATEEATAEATEEAAEEDGATIVRLASETPDLNTLGTLVIRAGLFDALSDTDTELTVFAPTNEAFTAALDALGITLDELVSDREALRNILLYHVVEGEVTSDMLEAGDVTTLNGATVTISLEDGVMVNDATVVIADVQASNGVVHVIDGVLLPPAGDDAEATEEGEGDE